jgi:hypothetical protein
VLESVHAEVHETSDWPALLLQIATAKGLNRNFPLAPNF